MNLEIKKERNTSIELLKIIAAIGVIILHYNNANGGGAFKYADNNSLNMYYFKLSNSIFVCAVNVFFLISGYYLSKTNNRKISKVIELFFQLLLFELIFYIFNCINGTSRFSFTDSFSTLMPNNYFVTLYSVLYIISPYFNIIFDNIKKNAMKKMIIILFFIFSVWSFGVDFINGMAKYFINNTEYNGFSPIGLFGSQMGYTIVNFSLIYFLGAYIQKNEIFIKKSKLLIIFIISSFLIFLLSIVSGIAYNYNNPFVIIAATSIFLLFKEIHFDNKIINELAKASFISFLFHSYFIDKLMIKMIVSKNILIVIIHQLLSSVILFSIAYLVYKVYKVVFNFLLQKLKKLEIINLYN